MRKQVLFIALFAILLSGCTPTDDVMMGDDENIVPVVEEAAVVEENTAASGEVEDFQTTMQEINNVNIENKKIQLEQDKAEDEQMQKELDLLGSFNGTPSESDCNKLNLMDLKLACMELIEK